MVERAMPCDQELSSGGSLAGQRPRPSFSVEAESSKEKNLTQNDAQMKGPI